ncbi:hypothetical protein V8E55_011229 [Tylopilus felleus]
MTLLDRNPAYPQLVRPTSAYDMDDPERDSYPFDGFQVPGRARQTRFDDLPQGPRDSDGVGGCLVELRSHVQAVVCVSLFHAHSPSPSTGNERYIGCASPGEPPLTARASTWIDWKYQFHSTVERLEGSIAIGQEWVPSSRAFDDASRERGFINANVRDPRGRTRRWGTRKGSRWRHPTVVWGTLTRWRFTFGNNFSAENPADQDACSITPMVTRIAWRKDAR